MNRVAFSKLIAMTAMIAFFVSGARLNSQETGGVAPKTPQELLAALKASNATLLQKQQASLQKLEELKQQAEQLRILAKRS